MKFQNEPEIRRSVVVPCRFGLNLRVAARVVALARRYQAEVYLKKEGLSADAKSVFSIILLAAARGRLLDVVGRGTDADQVVQAIAELFESKELLCGEEKATEHS